MAIKTFLQLYYKRNNQKTFFLYVFTGRETFVVVTENWKKRGYLHAIRARFFTDYFSFCRWKLRPEHYICQKIEMHKNLDIYPYLIQYWHHPHYIINRL